MNRETVKTLQDLVRQAAAEYGDKVFLKEKAENDTIAEASFAQFYADSLRVAAFLNDKAGTTGCSITRSCNWCNKLCVSGELFWNSFQW